MKQKNQNVADVREDISEIIAICVAALKMSIVLSANREDFLRSPIQDHRKLQSLAETRALVSTACLTAQESKEFRREWEIEAEKHGVSPSPDPTELVVNLLYKLAQGDATSSDDLQSWIDMFKAVDALAHIPADEAGTLN